MEERYLELLRETEIERVIRLEREAKLRPEEWRIVPGSEWEREQVRAGELEKLSSVASNTRVWSPHYLFLGCMGEWLYSRVTGQPRNMEIKIADGGVDFPDGTDVKATSHWESPYLMRLKTDPFKAARYVLVAVDMQLRRVRIVGQASREKLENAPLGEYGYGPTRTLYESDLDPL